MGNNTKNISFKGFGKIYTEAYIESIHCISPYISCLFRAHSVMLILEKPRADLLYLYRRYITDSDGVAAAAASECNCGRVCVCVCGCRGR